MLSSIATLIHDTYLPLYLQDVLGMSNTKVTAALCGVAPDMARGLAPVVCQPCLSAAPFSNLPDGHAPLQPPHLGFPHELGLCRPADTYHVALCAPQIGNVQAVAQFLSNLTKSVSGTVGDLLSPARMVIFGTLLTTLNKPMFAASGWVFAWSGSVGTAYWITSAKVWPHKSAQSLERVLLQHNGMKQSRHVQDCKWRSA